MSVLQPILLHMEHSNAVGIFTKRGVMEETAAFLRTKGYNVQFIDFDDPENSPYGYDPLDFCRSRSDVKALAHSIIKSSPKGVGTDSYWSDSAEILLDIVLGYVWEGNYERGRTMQAALELLDLVQWPIADEENDDDDDEEQQEEKEKLFGGQPKADPEMQFIRFRWDGKKNMYCKEDQPRPSSEPISKEPTYPKGQDIPLNSYYLRKAFKKLKQTDPRGYSVWNAYINLPDGTGACVTSSLHTPLQNIFTAEVRRILANKKQFAFDNLLKPKTILFLHVSPVNPAQHLFVGIFYNQLFKSLFELAEREATNVLPYPVHVLCDDFATGCRISNFPDLISIFREKRISAVMLIQSESQLTSMYNSMDATTIINNCDTLIYMGGMDLATCQSMSVRANRPAADFFSMAIGMECMFRRGQKPIFTKRYEITNDPMYWAMQKKQESTNSAVYSDKRAKVKESKSKKSGVMGII